MSNNREISKLIQRATGLEGVKVYSGGGCCRFYSDNEVTSEILALVETDTVWVCYISQLAVQQWLSAFESNFDDQDRVLVRLALQAAA